MVNDGDCVAIFHSIQRVMKAEKSLLDSGLDIVLIPVPRTLSADCGMAVRFPLESRPAVEDVLAGVGLEIAELWLMRDQEFRRLD